MNYERLGKLFEVTAEARAKVRSKKGLARAGQRPRLRRGDLGREPPLQEPRGGAVEVRGQAQRERGLLALALGHRGAEPARALLPRAAAGEPHRQPGGDLKDFERGASTRASASPAAPSGAGTGAAAGRLREGARAALRRALPAGLRRRPEDIAGWPEINRILTPIGLDARRGSATTQAWTEFRASMELAPSGRDPAARSRRRCGCARRARSSASPAPLELVRELLENGHQVAVSVAFIETLEALREGLVSARASPARRCTAGCPRPGARGRADALSAGRGAGGAVHVEEGISLHQGEHNEAPRSR
jgi:hypothetical protein